MQFMSCLDFRTVLEFFCRKNRLLLATVNCPQGPLPPPPRLEPEPRMNNFLLWGSFRRLGIEAFVSHGVSQQTTYELDGEAQPRNSSLIS